MFESSPHTGLTFAPVVAALVVELAVAGLGATAAAPGAAVPGQDETQTGESPAIVMQIGQKAGNAKHDAVQAYRNGQFEQREARLRRAALERAELAARSIRGLVVDGKPVSGAFARGLAERNPDYRNHVVYIDQRPVMSAGCELISLDVALMSMGFELPLTEIADRYLVSGGDVENYYQGSPYANGGGYPQSIVNAANAWLADHGGGSAHAYNLTGTSYSDLCTLVEMGYPVLVWTTEGMSSPSVGGSWYYPEHCVVMYDVDGGIVKVSDSLAGLVERDRDRFGEIYAAAGSRAAVVLPISNE